MFNSYIDREILMGINFISYIYVATTETENIDELLTNR